MNTDGYCDDLLIEGMEYMRRRYDACGLSVHISAGETPEAERAVREVSREAKKRIATYQKRAGKIGCRTVVWCEANVDQEGATKFCIVAPMPGVEARDKLIASLNSSDSRIIAKRVRNWLELTGHMLTQASCRASVIGGDRVRLSRDLTAALERSGRTQPFKRTYAARRGA